MEGLRSWRNGIVTLGLLIAASPAPGFFIRGGTPPPIQQAAPPVVKTPNQSGGGGGTNTVPPGPTGDGETPTGTVNDPPNGPVTSTPEPASLVSALVGAGLAAGYAWRKRRKATAA